MTFQKIALRGGINREGTRYTNEGGWYDGDKIRFRQGTPEKIGGWQRIGSNTFLGVCRALHNWVSLAGANFVGLGTNLKYYIELGGAFNDITPLRATQSLTNPFTTISGSTTVLVTDANGGFIDEDFVTFSGGTAVGGITISGEFQIDIVSSTTYNITVPSAASSSATGGGSVSAAYQVNVGSAFAIPLQGWGAGAWGAGDWGVGEASINEVRIWSHSNFGEDLIFGPNGGSIYLWDATNGVNTRAVELSSLAGASDVPVLQNLILVSDVSRFVFCMGTNPIGSSAIDPTLIRWSDQEDATNWTPSIENQAGSLRLSRGTKIVAASQARQEVLVWTDSSLYSLQYVGAPAVWTATLVGENISISSQLSVSYASGIAYWMGVDKFYMYDGRVQPLKCDVRKYVFNDLNTLQYDQVFSGTNESFHEIWWFYCSADSNNIDKYVIYNYLEKTWYYGTLGRTAWLDSGLRNNPLAATYNNVLVDHELGVDDNETGTTAAIVAHVVSAEFDLNDGHQFTFVNKIIPDITFDGSTSDSPVVTLTLNPLTSSGSGYKTVTSEGGSNSGTITRTSSADIEKYTELLHTRIRARQMSMRVESNATGVTWQFGSPRLDMRPDGRR
ncbi:hypothetical protein [Hyphomonas sp.]|uniref:hypothetical protein n=1 Tax=Hyphomonas sp. TaxID=87 RepID=UPI0025C6E4E7|nr:hypothetical protein [Hyphomonas sp.]